MVMIDFAKYEKFVDGVTSDESKDFVALADRLVELDREGANIERLYTGATGIACEGGEILEIVDDGPGMDTETLDRAFEVYYSTKKGGSGLGLALVRRVVEAHEGQVEIQSSPGFGTRVMLRLPRGEGEHPDTEAEPQA